MADDDLTMTRIARHTGMRIRTFAIVALCTAVLHAQDAPSISPDLAAKHPEGKWKIRKADLYRYLVRFNAGQPSANGVLDEYMKERMVEGDARKYGIGVSRADVDAWLEDLDRRVRAQGVEGLDALRKQQGMREGELRRKGRTWLFWSRLAGKILETKDPTRPKGQRVPENTVILTIDELYRKRSKTKDRSRLPRNVVARIGEVDITTYEYGRVLSYSLPVNEVYRALLDLVLSEEVKLLTGNDKPPTAEEQAVQERWYLDYHKNRLKGQVSDHDRITDQFIKDLMGRRGLPWTKLITNPGFRAQARARGHFKRAQTEESMRKHYTQFKGRFGDKLKVARILVKARQQRVVNLGTKMRTLEQGKAASQALWLKIKAGEDFGEMARQHSEDPDILRLNGGKIPQWISAESPGFEQVYQRANELKRNEYTKPFFLAGRGYVIVKLLDRQKSGDFASMRKRIRIDAAEREYQLWRRKVSRAAVKNREMFEN